MGVGAASGFVTVGVIGAASRLEYTAVGPAVNLAARLCAEASHGEILVDLRTIELLLGLPPMSQYDAAATPMYASLGDAPDLTPYTHLEATHDLDELNTKTAWGAEASESMDWSEFDRTPMFALNEILWKSVKGADSEMPLPRHRFAPESLVAGGEE